MADGKPTPDAEGNDAPDGATGAEGTTVTMEQYKNLQRKLAREQERNKAAVMAQLNSEALAAQVESMNARLDYLFDQGGYAGRDDDGDKGLEDLRKHSKVLSEASNARRAIMELVLDNDASWDDEALADSRRAFESGQYDQAVAAAKTAFTSRAKDEDLDAKVEARLAAVLRERGMSVDSGSTVAASGVPTDPAMLRERLNDRSPEGRKWRAEHIAELRNLVKRGAIK